MKKISDRNEKIVQLHTDGVKQVDIAKKYGITRQRVQQIEASLGLDRKKEKVIFSKDCAGCDKYFESKNPNRKYCSRDCSSLGRRVERTGEYLESIREKKRIRANEYYHRIIKKIK